MAIEHPLSPPSTHATIRVNYGSEFKHLYSLDSWGGIAFHKSHTEALENAHRMIEDDANVIVAVLKVEELIAAKIDVQTVCKPEPV